MYRGRSARVYARRITAMDTRVCANYEANSFDTYPKTGNFNQEQYTLKFCIVNTKFRQPGLFILLAVEIYRAWRGRVASAASGSPRKP